MSLKKRFTRKLKAYGLMLVAGKQRAARWNPNQVDRILVFRFDRIGDMVVTTPFLAQLERGFPAATIEVLCSPANADVLEGMPRFRPVVLASGLFRLRQLLGLRGRVDLVIDLNHSVIWRDLLFIRILQPRFVASVFKEGRYGVLGSQLGLFSVMAQSRPIGVSPPLYETYLDLAEALGCRLSDDFKRYSVPILAVRSEVAKGKLAPVLNFKIFGINQFGGHTSRQLRDADVLWAAQRLLDVGPETAVVLLTSPKKYSSACCLAQELPAKNRFLVWEPTESVMDTAASLSLMSGLVTPDTSLVHFACAFNIPLLTVYSRDSVHFAHWRPVSDAPVRVIFSRDAKSLNGYSQDEFQDGVDKLLRLTQQP